MTVALALDDDALAQLADRVADRILECLPEPEAAEGWLDTSAAASYLGISNTALHKLTSARRLKFSQDVTGGRCFFRRAELDAFREQGMKGG